MKIAVLGASGRVGGHLVKQVMASEEDQLVACLVSANSQVLGKTVPGSSLEYVTEDLLLREPCDLLVDFSTPESTMAIIDDIENRCDALVVGTTGFSDDQMERIAFASESHPILVSANFAEAFEPFVQACRSISSAYPDRLPQLEETYHERKKPVASGTSLRLQREIADARRKAGAPINEEIPLQIIRAGDATGKHTLRLEDETFHFDICFEVLGLESYARGALRAGRWLLGRDIGLYSAADILSSREATTP